jgi:cytochrome c oxidase subunit 4
MQAPPRRLTLAWLILVALLAGNAALAFVLPPGFSLAANLSVAAVMAIILLSIFMELGRRLSLYWIFAGAGFFWLALLFGLTASDYLTRFSFAPI